jgi:hypothetical protein
MNVSLISFLLLFILLCSFDRAAFGCSETTFIGGTILQFQDDNKTANLKFTGALSLVNVNGEGCLVFVDPSKDQPRVIVKMRIAKVQVDRDTSFKYRTSPFRVKVDAVSTPGCPTLAADNCVSGTSVCDEATCKNNLSPVSTDGLLFFSAKCQNRYSVGCFLPEDVQIYTRCIVTNMIVQDANGGYGRIGTDTMYSVNDLTNPKFNIELRTTIDYLNGTTVSKAITIDVLHQTNLPFLVVEGVSFKQNGLSLSNYALPPDKDSVVIHEGTRKIFLAKASATNQYVTGMLGAFQCPKSGTCQNNLAAMCNWRNELIYNYNPDIPSSMVNFVHPVPDGALLQSSQMLPNTFDGKYYFGTVTGIKPDLSATISQVLTGSIGTLSIYVSGQTTIGIAEKTIVPVCISAKVTSSCYQCDAGTVFSLTVSISSGDGAAVQLGIEDNAGLNGTSVDLLQQSIYATSAAQVFPITARTNIAKNDVTITVYGTNGAYCKFENITFNSTRIDADLNKVDNVDQTPGIQEGVVTQDNGGFWGSIEKIFGSIVAFVGTIIGGIFGFIVIVLTVVACLCGVPKSWWCLKTCNKNVNKNVSSGGDYGSGGKNQNVPVSGGRSGSRRVFPDFSEG